jgi:hypothetical protein
MQNLNSPQIVRGPLLASEMHRVTVIDGQPQAAECCTDIGVDDYDGTGVFRGLASAILITAICAAVVLALI